MTDPPCILHCLNQRKAMEPQEPHPTRGGVSTTPPTHHPGSNTSRSVRNVILSLGEAYAAPQHHPRRPNVRFERRQGPPPDKGKSRARTSREHLDSPSDEEMFDLNGQGHGTTTPRHSPNHAPSTPRHPAPSTPGRSPGNGVTTPRHPRTHQHYSAATPMHPPNHNTATPRHPPNYNTATPRHSQTHDTTTPRNLPNHQVRGDSATGTDAHLMFVVTLGRLGDRRRYQSFGEVDQ